MTRPGGRVLVIDQIAPVDPLAALELNRFERARDASTTRVLADVDLRGLFEANGLVLEAAREVSEPRELESYLDAAACEGDADRTRRSPLGLYTALVGCTCCGSPGCDLAPLDRAADRHRLGSPRGLPASTASIASRR